MPTRGRPGGGIGRENRQAWMEVLELLLRDPGASVPCPNCGDAPLTVFVLPSAEEPRSMYIRCKACWSDTWVRLSPSGRSELAAPGLEDEPG